MNPNTQQTVMTEYARTSAYINEPSNLSAGHIPLDTLPAAWWNWLWNRITKNNNEVYSTLTDLRTELLNVLSQAGITADEASTNQLYQAINRLRQTIATTSVAGAVKSSSNIKSVSVGSNGTMLVNALTDWAGDNTIQMALTNLTTAVRAGDIKSFTISRTSSNTFSFVITHTDDTTSTQILQPVHSVSVDPDGNYTATTVNGIQSSPTRIIDTDPTNTCVWFDSDVDGDGNGGIKFKINGVTIPYSNTAQVLLLETLTASNGYSRVVLETGDYETLCGTTLAQAHVGFLGTSNYVYADSAGYLHCKGIQFDV